ncbi:MAG: hypothetical protein ACK4WH_02005, partial [Phycisphaerales bacterium]
HSPFVGVVGRGWFLSFHELTRYVKVTVFNGLALRPIPPGGTEKSGESRWIDIYEGDWGGKLDQETMASWVKQAAALPGWAWGERGVVGGGVRKGAGMWREVLPGLGVGESEKFWMGVPKRAGFR